MMEDALPEAGSLQEFELLLGLPPESDELFAEYLSFVANDGLLPYKTTIHYAENAGGKAGESLYQHLLNGIFVLEQLRKLLQLAPLEAKVLLSAFTLHDINKMLPDATSYRAAATPENIIAKFTELRLDQFFPGYDGYLEDIRSLMQRTSGHQWVGSEVRDLRRVARYGLPTERLDILLGLMRAADGIDLSHTLTEQRHKETFLFHLNSVSREPYTLVSHAIAEQRGSFTNIVHNAALVELQQRYGLTPLLLYPEGVAYLCLRGHEPVVDDQLWAAIARRAAGTINGMTSADFATFIRPINMGITVDRKCLELGLPFDQIFDAIAAIVARRPYKAEKIEQLATDAIRRTRDLLVKRSTPLAPETQAALEALLATGPLPAAPERMRLGELVRSYYIFLIEHLAEAVPDAWGHLYQLLAVSVEQVALYDCFDARMDRAYVLAKELPFAEQTLVERIIRDGDGLLAAQPRDDPRAPLLETYLRLVLRISGQPASSADFAASLPTYVRQYHRQCVQCSLPLPTEPWMTSDVRTGIKVQTFSNRLAGAPSEPKKRVCGICHLQYLVEKLNYSEKRDEQPVYLHLYPYSFLAAPFASALRTGLGRISRLDALGGAMRLRNAEEVLRKGLREVDQRVQFTTRTKEDRPQPYGIYLPRYSDTLGGMFTLPINAPGENDSARFLFVLQHAMLLWQVLGCKVLISTAATPPLDAQSFGDIYVDLTPLSARGLVRQSDFHYYRPRSKEPGTLQQLWQQFERLYAVRSQLATRDNDPTAALVRAMAEHPLTMFYVAEKLAEQKAGDAAAAGWAMSRIFVDVRALALSTGDREMATLDTQLQQLAAIAWQHGLRRPGAFTKNSLMTPLDEVLAKLALLGDELNLAVVRAAAAEDLFEHIKRMRKAQNLGAGKRTDAACRSFVDLFFDEVFLQTYQGKLARLLSHEKMLRSAFHAYVRNQATRTQPGTSRVTIDNETITEDTDQNEEN
jgi:CRISPR-associated protein Csc3